MIELISYNHELFNTKTRITLDLIKDGEDFLKKYEINQELLIDTISIIYKFLKAMDKIPHNLFKFFIAAYYITSRHPMAFPVHESKKEFCQKFGLKQNSLDYCVEKITFILEYIKILDDMNYPYFIDPERDIGFKLLKSIINSEVDKASMNFLIYNQPINSQILSERLVSKISNEIKLFPEELLRQYFEIISQLVEKKLDDYYQYVSLQKEFFI